MRVVDSRIGRVVLHAWDDYVADGLGRNSMGALAKQFDARAVFLVKKRPEDVTDIELDQMIEQMRLSAEQT